MTKLVQTKAKLTKNILNRVQINQSAKANRNYKDKMGNAGRSKNATCIGRKKCKYKDLLQISMYTPVTNADYNSRLEADQNKE